MTTKVSIIITAHNYGKYLPQSLESALNQTYGNIEVVVVNDGSTDHTKTVLKNYEHDPRLKVVELPGIGLAAACNRGIAESTGEYIVRLDADDYFDENLVLVEAAFLNKYPNIGLVFCDYHMVNAHGDLIQTVRRAKVADEVELLDRPALAAGAMYRRWCYNEIGGYNESLRYQEDYDFWIKFVEKFPVRNVSLPLMYYRQHENSMSRNWSARMATRRQVKERFVRENRDRFNQTTLAVIPARADMIRGKKLPTLSIGDTDLLHLCIDKLKSVDLIDRVIVSTDDEEIADKAIGYGAEVPYIRNRATRQPAVTFEAVLIDLLRSLHTNDSYRADSVVIAHPHSPFVSSSHIVEAVDTLLLFDADSVVAVVEDMSYHWQVGRTGLSPVGYQKRVVRQDKDVIYKEAGGLYVAKTDNLVLGNDLFGKRISHIELAPWEALRIRNPYDHWVAEKLHAENPTW